MEPTTYNLQLHLTKRRRCEVELDAFTDYILSPDYMARVLPEEGGVLPIQDCDGPIDVMLVYPQMPRARQLDLPYGNEVPLSVATIAAYLEKHGVKTEILDMDLHREPYRLLRHLLGRLKPRIVAFTAMTPHIYNAHKAAAQVKDIDPTIVTVVGGIHVSALPEDTLRRFAMFDYVVLGEGEITFHNLVRHVLEGSDPTGEPGLAYRRDGATVVNPKRPQIEDLDALPFAAREKLEHDRYAGSRSNYFRLPTTCIAASRGCPYNCTNCSKGVYGRRSLRAMSPERAIAELQHCVRTLGIRNFKMIDDTITSDKKWVYRFCELLLEKDMNLTWSTMARMDAADLEMLKTMHRAGCFQLKWGPECGTEKSLKRIRKGITLEQSEQAIEWCRRAGIESNASFMIGIPGETVEDIEATIDFACKISPDVATFAILKPFPGSEVYDEAVAEGRILHTVWEEYLHQGFALMRHDVLGEEQLERLFKRCYNRFYFRPRYWAKRIKWFFKQPLREGGIIAENFWMLVSKK